uniref:hypothetical protein n=1 Tax=Ruminococcus sp. TaxID=41978 RepID=UPI003FF022E5
MKINAKRITAVLMAAAMSVCATTAAFAASTTDTPIVDENHATADFQQKITYSKSESEIVPAYTVSIPLTAELQKESSTLSYSLALENDTAFVPNGKKVSVKIESAGYSGNLHTLAVWDSRNLQEAEYVIYNSDAFANPTYYTIGDEIASWDGSNFGTITRKIKLKDYYSVGAGNYNGVINYTVSLEDK